MIQRAAVIFAIFRPDSFLSERVFSANFQTETVLQRDAAASDKLNLDSTNKNLESRQNHGRMIFQYFSQGFFFFL